MTKAYLIAYGENPNDRLTALAFNSRRAATRVVANIPDVRFIVSNEEEVDNALPGKILVEVYNGLTGEQVNKFPRRADGARRLFAALPRVAREEPVEPPSPAPVRSNRGRTGGSSMNDMSSETESAAETTREPRARRFPDPSAARGKGIEISSAHQVELLVNENPKRGGAAERFARYTNGMSIEEALQQGITKSDIRWDVAHNYIRLMDPPN